MSERVRAPSGWVRGGRVRVPEYHGARETPWEAGWPTTQDYRPSVTDSEEYREGTVKSPPGGE